MGNVRECQLVLETFYYSKNITSSNTDFSVFENVQEQDAVLLNVINMKITHANIFWYFGL